MVEESIHLVFDEPHFDLSMKEYLVKKVDKLNINDEVYKDYGESNQEVEASEGLLQENGTMSNPLTSLGDEVNFEGTQDNKKWSTTRKYERQPQSKNQSQSQSQL